MIQITNEPAQVAMDALNRQLVWHEARKKELSKSGRSHAYIGWEMLQHSEEIDALTVSITELQAAIDAPEQALRQIAEFGELQNAQPEVQQLEFLLDGARVKLNFNKVGNMTSLHDLQHELQGRWVCFVGAENDKHLRALPPEPQARELVLLREARVTLETWKDVAPAVSLCRDIDVVLAARNAP